jgi:uncharacterized cupin superfamily protein
MLSCMPKRLNIQAVDISYDDTDPEGFRSGGARLGPLLGASRTGATVYELPPGQSICPYHYEYGEEEWLLVLSGRPTLRHPEGTDQLEEGDIVCFPTGPEGAHAVKNDAGETVRVLMFSNRTEPAACVYPDSGKVGVWTGNTDDDLIVERSSGVGYWHGEAPEA